MVHILLVPALTPLYLYVTTFRSMCAVPNMAVFCSSLTSWFPGMLLTYFLNDFEMVPVVPIITGITFVFTFHMRCISIVRSLYFRIFSVSLLLLLLLLSSSSSSSSSSLIFGESWDRNLVCRSLCNWDTVCLLRGKNWTLWQIIAGCRRLARGDDRPEGLFVQLFCRGCRVCSGQTDRKSPCALPSAGVLCALV